MLDMCLRILFVFPSCSLRILLVFLAFSPGAARVALPHLNGIAAVALSASDGATTAMFRLDQALMEPFALHAGPASAGHALRITHQTSGHRPAASIAAADEGQTDGAVPAGVYPR